MSSDTSKWHLYQRDGSCSYPLSQYGLIFIGCEECDIILQSPGVEKRHAVLSYNTEKQDFFIKDLNSMTGTYINDTRIPEQSYFKLNHKDQIRLGYGAFFTLSKESPESERKEPNQIPQEEPLELQEADSLEDLKDASALSPGQSMGGQHVKEETSRLQEKREELTLNLNKTGHKISPLSSQVIINYSVALQSPDRRSEDMSSKTNGSADSSDSSAGTMTLTAAQQQPAAMAFTIPFDGEVSSKTFTRKKPRLKDERSRNQTPESDRGTRLLRPLNKSSSEEHSSETEHTHKMNGADRKVSADKKSTNRNEAPLSEGNNQATLSDTTSYLIQRMLDGSTPQATKWANKRSPETTPLLSCWSGKKTPEKEPVPLLSSPKWTANRKTPDNEIKPPSSPSQTRWGIHELSSQESPPPSKWVSSRKTPEQASPPPAPTKWSSSRKTPEQEHPPPSKWAIRSSSGSQESPVHPSTPSKEKDCDDKSETGTYTVDTDLDDPVVEEARNKIDEVFGVPDNKSEMNFAMNSHTLPVNSKANDLRGHAIEPKQPKHSIPTPPAEKNSFDFIPLNHIMTNSTPNLYGNAYRTRKETYVQEVHAQTPPPRPPPRANRTSLIKLDTSSQDNGARSTIRSFSHNEVGDSLSDGSPQATKHSFYGVSPWRRKSWNISCSDLELDQGKVETSSVLSDLSTSTEPSSHSSHSSRSRSGDVGPQMRLNRAFALRRARLGFESDEPVRLPPQGVQAVRPLPRGASVSQNNLSRQDGGRFSLRLPRSAMVKTANKLPKPRENKSVVQPFQQDTRSYLGETKKPFKKGPPTNSTKQQQPAKGRPLKSLSVSSSDSEPRRLSLNSGKGQVQKSASFSGGLQSTGKSKRPLTGGTEVTKRQTPPVTGTGSKKRTTTPIPPATGQTAAGKKSLGPRPPSGVSARSRVQPVAVRRETVLPSPDVDPLQPHTRSKKEVSALDSLVISAIQQLSVKLKGNACHLLERERQKFPESSDTRLMIEEILPQMMDKRPSDIGSEGNLTRDLSSILKNLKRVEQTLDVFAILSEQHPPPAILPSPSANEQLRAKPSGKRGFFVVDV